MSQAPVGASGLVRVTVASGARRVDLVLPGSIPVAELVPELARSVGLLDAATVYGGYSVVTAEGRELATDIGLIAQGIEDGGVLTLGAGADKEAPRVYDDIVEAMTDVVERDLTPWQPAAGRRTALWAAGLLLALGAVALFVQRDSLLAGVTAAVLAVALVTGAIVLSRAQREPAAAVAVGWIGTAYAGMAGFMLGSQVFDGPTWGLPLACAGAGALLLGAVALLGLGQGRTLVIPGVVVGAILLVAGGLVDLAGWDPAVVLCTVLVVVVLAGSVFPWLALGMTTTDVDQLFTHADITAEPDEIDAAKVTDDARVAHEILIAVTGTVGLLLVLVTPFAVGLGLWGTLLAVAACIVVMTRTRQYRVGAEVLVGLVSGIAGLLVTAAAVIVLHPDWRPTVAVVLAVAGGLLLAATLVPGEPSLRRGRIGDIVETIGLLALIPLLVLASGVLGSMGF
ncbi:EsaB/YukD family protein [Nocardioides insulae]|uniref:EsaB/YukD family protein n=1 Tax=Nocardioides insulae TaxID=394734 RepID=UPI00040CFAB2|nr:EsaB/YukD family protein [Nocardioides insulae]